MTNYLKYINEIFIVLFLCFASGTVLLNLVNFSITKVYTKVFLALLGGIVLLTVLQAAISTKLNTILLIAPVVIGFAYYLDKSRISKNKNKIKNWCHFDKFTLKWQTIIELIFLVLILYSIKYFEIYQDGNLYSIREASQDFGFYSRCVDYILRTGVEVCNNDYIFTSTNNKPYHYGDLWFAGLISNINKNITLISVVLTFKVIHLILIYVGILAILENYFGLDYKLKIAAVLTLFFTPLYIESYRNIKFLSEMSIFTQSFDESQKLFFIQALIICSILLNINKYFKLGVVVLLLIPVFYTVVIIPVFAGFIIYLLCYYINTRRIMYDEIAFSIIIGLYILFFYFILNPSIGEQGAIHIYIFDLINFKHTINIIGGVILAHLILYLPIGLLLFVCIMRNSVLGSIIYCLKGNPIYVFIAVMPIFGLLLWSITSGNSDSVQFFYNISVPVLYTASIILILSLFILLGKGYKLMIFTFLILTAANVFLKQYGKLQSRSSSFSYEFAKKVIDFNGIYATYKPASWYYSIFSFGDKGINLGNYISYFKNNAQPVSLDIIDIPIVGSINYKKMASRGVQGSTFYRYVEEKKSMGLSKTNQEYQLDFIKEYNVTLLVTLKKVKLPEFLDRLVVDRIEDDVSGEVICILKN